MLLQLRADHLHHLHHHQQLVLLALLPLHLPLLFACAPPPHPSPFFATNLPSQTMGIIEPRHPANSRAFGEQIHQPRVEQDASSTDAPAQNALGGIDQRASTASGPIKEPRELFCYDFDDKCRWRNMEGFLVDDFDWYQGAGFLDENRLRLATGTHISPDGFYGITATDKIELSGAKGILVSDVIQCQTGNAELRFMYWTSPEVKITICVKSVLRLFPYFDYCSTPVENNDPGPAYIILPDLGGDPLQIFIQAHNFVFNSAALQGGFAIIDNLEYYGEFCDNGSDGFLAQSNSARSETAPRLAPRPKGEEGALGWGPELIYNSVIENPPAAGGAAGGGGGFSSLLDWMLYGGGRGLGGNGNGTKPTPNTLPTTFESATPPNAAESIFELSPATNNFVFPTLVPSAQGFGPLPTMAPISDPIPTNSDQQMSSSVPPAFPPFAAIRPSKSQSEFENALQPNLEMQNQLNAKFFPQNRPSAKPMGGIRSFRIVQQQKSNKEENIGQQTMETHHSANRGSKRPLPHLALLPKVKEEEAMEKSGRKGAVTELAEKDEEEEREEEEDEREAINDREGGGGGGGSKGRGGAEDEESATEEPPDFVEKEEWIGRGRR
ncbi:hypothetical protein niasHT_018967 [Heterodera trifolii]|uniref:MAM domain-containing protein n=1 Tax=Heterodera trifolii TaxID=157864 RepID=A0ABD2LEP4_9BILA